MDLSSVADFSNTEARDPTSAERTPYFSLQRAMQFGHMVWIRVMVTTRNLLITVVMASKREKLMANIRQGHLIIYCFDYAMPSIKDTIEKLTKACILRFPKKGDLGIIKDNRGITLTAIFAKVYNGRLLNHMKPEIENFFKEK